MSRFLQQLVQRSLTKQTAVRPRPVTVFDPIPLSLAQEIPRATLFGKEPNPSAGDRLRPDRRPTGAETAAITAELRIDDAAPVAAEPRPRPAQGLDPHAKNSHDRPWELHTPVRHRERVPINSSAETGAVEPTTRTTPESAAVVNGRASSPTPVATTGRTDSNAGRPKGGSLETFAARNYPPAATEPIQQGCSVPADRSITAESLRDPRMPPDPLGAIAREVSTTSLLAILTPRPPRPMPVIPPSQSSESKPVEPVVHVTIGRVEIRAVTEAAAQKPSAPSKPSLSLGDYLRRRNGDLG